MWLPKDERKLLVFYYKRLEKESKGHLDLDKGILFASMEDLNPDLEIDIVTSTELEIMESPSYKKVKDTQGHLEQRGLLSFEFSTTGSSRDRFGGFVPIMMYTYLTLAGSDLARKYNHWFTRWGLWWQEHKVNPIWIIIGFIITFIAGIVSTVLVNEMTSPKSIEKPNIYADVSKDGSILRSNDFLWEIRKSKNEEGNVLYTMVDRRGDKTAISVVPDNPKPEVYQSSGGMVIKYTCAEKEIPDFTIKVKY